jgi:phage portal protein BeeE
MTLLDFISILCIIILIYTVRKGWQQASKSDKEEAIKDFVDDTLTKAARQGEQEWREWYPNGIKPTRTPDDDQF